MTEYFVKKINARFEFMKVRPSRNNIYIAGFTFMELLVSMVIMGILASVFLANYPRMQLRSRDAQRKSDLKQYATALEGYANKYDGFYPEAAGAEVSVATLCPSPLEVSGCPVDPRDGQADCQGDLCRYYYQSDGDTGGGADRREEGTRYTLRARMEEEEDSTSTCSYDVFYVLCSTGETGYFCNGPGATAFVQGVCPL